MDFSFIFHETAQGLVAELSDNTGIIAELDDMVDLLGNASFSGAQRIIIQKKHLPEDFFVLRNGMAGEVLQKFSNYRMRLAVVGDFSSVGSSALRDFIRESNTLGHIQFLPTTEEALRRL